MEPYILALVFVLALRVMANDPLLLGYRKERRWAN